MRSSLKGRERAIVNQTNIGTPHSLKGRQRAIVNQTNIVERGSARRPSLNGRAIVNQTNAGTVSKATLGTILRDGVERIWAFPSAQIPS